ncbi:MAG TPA: hypothetical protein VF624_18870 [Tepidisphaeraceae bacterium]|jgi:hypothetical protein
MSRFPKLFAAVASLSLIAALPGSALAQEAGDLEMSKFNFTGTVLADNVYVRSGAGENDYPVLTLSRGQVVTVVGAKFDWLKILPPQGAFCVVGKPWIDRRGDGSVGRVRDDATANVRIGSTLNNMVNKIAVSLKGGEDVKILGDADGYYKIEPPAGTFLYVHKKFVEPGERVNVVSNNGAMEVKPVNPIPTPIVTEPTAVPVQPKIDAPPVPAVDPVRVAENGNAAAEPKQVASNEAPATQPVAAALSPTATFDALEARLTASSADPIEKQPIDELLAGYKSLVAEKKIPESMLRVAEYRAKGLQIRKDMLSEYQQVRKMQADIAPKQQALKAEGDEIATRLEQNRIKSFAAVGTLRSSALTMGGKTLYRLTDPASGRTVVYVQTEDPDVIKNEGRFVGVRGAVTDDTGRQIKFVQPTAVEQIEPTSVAKGDVTSTLTPPSLLAVTATTTGR